MDNTKTFDASDELVTLQLLREQYHIENGIARYREATQAAIDQGRASSTAPALQLQKELFRTAEDAVARYVDYVGSAPRTSSWAKVIKTAGIPTVAYLTLQHVINASSTQANLGTVVHALAEDIEFQVNTALAQHCSLPATVKPKNGKEVPPVAALMHWLLKTKHKGATGSVAQYAIDRQRRELLGQPLRAQSETGERTVEVTDEKGKVKSVTVSMNLSAEERGFIGLGLIESVIAASRGFSFGGVETVETEGLWELVSINESSRKGPKTVRRIAPTRSYLAYIEAGHAIAESVRPVFEPMLVEPLDWTSPLNGGYLTHELPLVRGVPAGFLADAHTAGAYDSLYRTVNRLQKTPWRINTFVLDTVRSLWENDAQLKEWPYRGDKKRPAKPAGCEGRETQFAVEHPEAWREWLKKAAEVHRSNESHARLAAIDKIQRQLDYAKSHVEGSSNKALYQVWFADFRLRLYPVASAITSQGDDLSKALLEFHRGERMTREAAFWLAVHVANSWGNDSLDKEPLAKRVAWVKENEERIVQAGTAPLDDLWWTGAQKSEKPFQFLAACYEWAQWVRYGCAAETHIVAGLDGSANGLQHYAALLRSEKEGLLVNLLPSDKPQDLYTVVATAVNEMLAGEEDWTKSISGQIDRGITKTPVMTYSYSVSYEGIKDQVYAKAKKGGLLNFTEDKGLRKQWVATVAKHTLASIQETVPGAAKGMNYLKAVTRHIAEKGLPVIYNTPDGCPVRLHILKKEMTQVQTYLQGGIRVKLDKADKVRNEIWHLAGLTLDAEIGVGHTASARRESLRAARDFLKSSGLLRLDKGAVQGVMDAWSADFDFVELIESQMNERSIDIPENVNHEVLLSAVRLVVSEAIARFHATEVESEETDEETGEIKRVRSTVYVANPGTELDVSAMLRGIGPDYIHSLDACHLRMTVDRCWDAGVRDFSMVHDSYGCHVTRLGEMFSLLRDAFVEMHSEALLETFAEEQVRRGYLDESAAAEYKTEFLHYGTLNLEQVKESEGFFS